MPRDVLPPVELVEGPRKRILTEKAREAAEAPLKHVKPRPVTLKAAVSTVSNPPPSVKSSLSTVAITVSVPDSVSKQIPVCPSDYTNDDYDWGTDRYSSPLSYASPLPHSSPPPVPSSPALYDTNDEVNAIEDKVNAIEVDSEAEDVKPVETAEAELGA